MKCFLQTKTARYDICYAFKDGEFFDVHYIKIGKHGAERHCDRVHKDEITKMIKYAE